MSADPKAVGPNIASELLRAFSPASSNFASLRMLFDAKREPLLRLRLSTRAEPPNDVGNPALADVYRMAEELAFRAAMQLEPESRPPVPAEFDQLPWGVVWEQALNDGWYMGELYRDVILKQIYDELASGLLRL